MNEKYKVWTCKIVVSGEIDLPRAFDSPPRKAVIAAIESAGIEVVGCSSGWGGSISKNEERFMLEMQGKNDVYVAGLVGETEH